MIQNPDFAALAICLLPQGLLRNPILLAIFNEFTRLVDKDVVPDVRYIVTDNEQITAAIADLAFYPIETFEPYDILLKKIIDRYELESLRNQGTGNLPEEDTAEWNMMYKEKMRQQIAEQNVEGKTEESAPIPEDLQTALNKHIARG